MALKDSFRKKTISLILQDASYNQTADGTERVCLVKILGVTDLVALGIALTIGAGIFSTIGNAAYWAGPGVIFLYIFIAMACACAALCYAEFASRVPIAGSAYTYAYVAMGELVAWIIGWDLLMEYTVSASTVSISWSEYFTGLLSGYGFNFPDFLSLNYSSASRGAEKIGNLLGKGYNLEQIKELPDMAISLKAYMAWSQAPIILGRRLVCNLPALMIISILTTLSCIGMKESKRVSNGMVVLKLATILFVIIAGVFYINPDNWNPFTPNGIQGVLKGASGVFFAYIGFDTISTTAEECRNPQRDLPRGIIISLVVCTCLYVAVALVLTGVVNYRHLQVADPIVMIFGLQGANSPLMYGIVAASAVVTMATVILCLTMAQPRVMMSMSRDGLLPPIFASIHPRFRTPWISTIITGLVVAIPAQFMSLPQLTDLTSIGTLFAFVLVCAGVLLLDEDKTKEAKFRIPYINSQYIFTPVLLAIVAVVSHYKPEVFFAVWEHPVQNINLMLFGIFSVGLAYVTFVKRLSFIPVMGLESCFYLMTELGPKTWIRFAIWLALGLVCYLLYGRRHSRLRKITGIETTNHSLTRTGT